MKNKRQSCAATHCGRRANQIAANACGRLLYVNLRHGFRLRASRQTIAKKDNKINVFGETMNKIFKNDYAIFFGNSFDG